MKFIRSDRCSRNRWIHAQFSILALLFFGFTAPEGAAKPPIDIVSTTGMIGDLVRSVAGPRAQVEVLMGEGVDPHLYKARPSDVRKLLRADITFYNGLFLEGRMAEVLGQAARRGRKVVALGEIFSKSSLLHPKESSGHPDPHVWMDVSLWRKTLEVIVRTLVSFDPTGESVYRANSEALSLQLQRLDRYVHEVIASIPRGNRVLVTAHDAFGYFGRAYNIDVQGIQGISTESEAGLADINRLVNFIATRKIPAVFVESSVPEKNVRALIEGTASRNHRLIVGGQLFSDAMGRPGSWEGTYIGMIDHNATTISRALGGSPPEGGYRAWKHPSSPEPKSSR